MNVLHISSEASWRGGEQQIMYLVEESRKLGVNAMVACRKGSKVEEYCRNNNLPFYTLPFSSAYDLRTALGIKRLCKKLNVDLIQTHTSKSHTLSVIAGVLGLDVPQILTRRVDFAVKDNWFSRFKYNYRKIKKVICISETILEITKRDIKDVSKLTMIHSGVDTYKFGAHRNSDWLRQKYNLERDIRIVGNTSAISDQKDYPTFIGVVEEVLNRGIPNVQFFIVGDGPDRESVENLVKERGLEHKVILTGFVTNIQEVLPSLDIFLFTSKTEGLGTSILDAMAAGVPIVTTNAGGIPEMITHGKNGLMYDVKDVSSLADGLIEVLNNPERGKQLAVEAFETVEDFSKEKTARRTVEVYREILENKSA
jgi:glycosyltransferase involved in cell wall biosynthesis